MPLHIPLRGVQVYDYVGTDVVHRHDAEVSELDELGGAYVQKKEITVGWLFGKDNIKVAFDMKSEVLGVPVYARLYVNGAVKGVQQSESGLSYVTKTETLSGLSDGDKIQLYLHGTPSLNLAVSEARWNDIRLFSGITDTITDEFNSPGIVSSCLAFDGVNLISCDFSTIYVHDGVTAAILRSFDGPDDGIRGLTVDGSGNLISCDYETDKIYVHDGITAAILRSFDATGTPMGLAFDGVNLISCDVTWRKIYVHDGVTAAITEEFDSPDDDPSGLAFDGVNLISCDRVTGKIYVHDGVSSSILRSYVYEGTAPIYLSGLETFYYPGGAAKGYAKNFRIIGESFSMAEKSMVFENTL